MSQLYTQPDLFLQERIPHKPYCTDDLTFGIRPRSYKTAITHRYIQVNPPHLRTFLLFDLDYAGAALSWEDNNLPMPAWAAINRENTHAHIAYALSAPVLTADFGGRQAALRYLAAIEAAYRAKLGGDDGFSGLITKNPMHPHWELLRGVPDAIRGYDLPYLADFVDLDRFKPYVGRSNVEAVGLGRNCTVFNVVSHWAYGNVLECKRQGITLAGWRKAVYERCASVNGDFPTPMLENEVKCIAKSIGNWVWTRFTPQSKSAWHAAQNARRKTHGAGSGRTKIITEL
ncbi:replication initiation protein [Neisseria bergeri]|uniref:replication initiation protein n=1 Tax=Neisseria bergeri TaxID=1906581 RepID=UPI0027298488|nr:replication initiation protein [Neisseria bergeri]